MINNLYQIDAACHVPFGGRVCVRGREIHVCP